MSNDVKDFDNLATRAFYIIILIVQNYFSDLYPAKKNFRSFSTTVLSV